MNTRRFLILIGLSAALALAGCNTVRGVGRDVERAGEVIQGRSAAAQPAAQPAAPVAVSR